MRTFSDTINIDFKTGFAEKLAAMQFENPLLNLMFSDDSDSHYIGIQDGNIFTITDYIWDSDKGTPELVFTNFPSQMAGEEIIYNNETLTPELGSYGVTVKLSDNPRKLGSYKNIKDRHSNWSIFDQRLPIKHINELKKGERYKITLQWQEYTAEYFFIFNIDPANIIMKDSSVTN